MIRTAPSTRLLSMLALCVMSLPSLASEPLKVVFINPGHESDNATGTFWAKVSRFMDAAANDLNIKLVTHYAERDHIYMTKLSAQLENADYIILVNEKGIADRMLENLQHVSTPIFMLLNPLTLEQKEQLTHAQKAKILGQVEPDNYRVGYNLAMEMLTKLNPHEQHKVLALQGDYTTPAAVLRKQGLIDALKQANNVELVDSPIANWSSSDAYRIVKGVYTHQTLSAIWAANDAMAFGAIEALNALDARDKVWVGGINFDKHPLGFKTNVSYGGHVTLGAQALVMLHDYHYKAIEKAELTQKNDIFTSDHQQNIELLIKLIEDDKLAQIDFKRFSHVYPNTLTFTLQNLVSASGKVH